MLNKTVEKEARIMFSNLGPQVCIRACEGFLKPNSTHGGEDNLIGQNSRPFVLTNKCFKSMISCKNVCNDINLKLKLKSNYK